MLFFQGSNDNSEALGARRVAVLQYTHEDADAGFRVRHMNEALIQTDGCYAAIFLTDAARYPPEDGPDWSIDLWSM